MVYSSPVGGMAECMTRSVRDGKTASASDTRREGVMQLAAGRSAGHFIRAGCAPLGQDSGFGPPSIDSPSSLHRGCVMRRSSATLGSISTLLALLSVVPAAGAQQDLANAKPGRDPHQAIDSAYTKKILEYTTEPFFLSPLVDYMPAAKGIPTPAAVLGDIAGNPNNLPHSKEVYEYMRLLAKSTPRVRVFSIGTTEEGREMIAVAVASDQLMAKLDANKADLAKLADPRTIGMNDAEADRIAQKAAPVYYVTGTIHSTESGAPTAMMEMAYRLAVDE